MKNQAWFVACVIVLLSLGYVAVSAPPLGAQGPTRAPNNPLGTFAQVAYQGRLTNASGMPIISAVQMVFKLYNDGGGLLWTSATRTVTPANGLFTVYLGADPDPNLTSTQLLAVASIGVTVGSDAEMTPRQPFNTVVGHSVTSLGVAGTSDSSAGVYGNSNSGVGVYGKSNSANGLSALSSGSAKDNAALRANNMNTGSGMAGYLTNNSGFANTHFYNAGAGEVLYLQNAYTGTNAINGLGGGPFITAVGSNTGLYFQVDHSGNVSQMRDANGLVKAGVAAYCAGESSYLTKYFNTLSGTTTVLDGTQTGECEIDLGFRVDDRFIVALVGWGHNVVTCAATGPSSNRLSCKVYDSTTGNGADCVIDVLVY